MQSRRTSKILSYLQAWAFCSTRYFRLWVPAIGRVCFGAWNAKYFEFRGFRVVTRASALSLAREGIWISEHRWVPECTLQTSDNLQRPRPSYFIPGWPSATTFDGGYHWTPVRRSGLTARIFYLARWTSISTDPYGHLCELFTWR